MRRKYLRVKKNRDGLAEQFELDKDEKKKLEENLHKQTSLHYAILQETFSFIPKNKISELNKKIKLLAEVSNIDQKDENSKDNQL